MGNFFFLESVMQLYNWSACVTHTSIRRVTMNRSVRDLSVGEEKHIPCPWHTRDKKLPPRRHDRGRNLFLRIYFIRSVLYATRIAPDKRGRVIVEHIITGRVNTSQSWIQTVWQLVCPVDKKLLSIINNILIDKLLIGRSPHLLDAYNSLSY